MYYYVCYAMYVYKGMHGLHGWGMGWGWEREQA